MVKPEQNSSNSINNQKTDIISKKRTIDKTQTNKTENRSLKTWRNFSQKEIMTIWHGLDIFLLALDRANLTRNRENLAKILT